MEPTAGSERLPAPVKSKLTLRLDAETAGIGVGIAAIGVCCATAVAGSGLGLALAGVLGGLAWFAAPLALAALAGVVLFRARRHAARLIGRVLHPNLTRLTAAGRPATRDELGSRLGTRSQPPARPE